MQWWEWGCRCQEIFEGSLLINQFLSPSGLSNRIMVVKAVWLLLSLLLIFEPIDIYCLVYFGINLGITRYIKYHKREHNKL